MHKEVLLDRQVYFCVYRGNLVSFSRVGLEPGSGAGHNAKALRACPGATIFRVTCAGTQKNLHSVEELRFFCSVIFLAQAFPEQSRAREAASIVAAALRFHAQI